MEWNKTRPLVVQHSGFQSGGAKGPAENWREDKTNNGNIIEKNIIIIHHMIVKNIHVHGVECVSYLYVLFIKVIFLYKLA